MNEIKFRGKSVINGKWVYGFFLVNQWDEPTICGKDFAVKVIAETVTQYTGLQDKNDKRIYGGDICKLDILGQGLKYNPLEALLVVIEYKNASWGFRHLYPELVVEEDREWCSFWRSDEEEIWDREYFEVVGDIHSNSDFLQTGK